MKYLTIPALTMALLLGGCETTPEGEDGLVDGNSVHIPAKDLEPAAEFIHRTKRMLVAEFIMVEMSAQLYESQLGLSRDLEYVVRTNATLKDGTVVVSLKRKDSGQDTNLDPDRLPRLYFGTGLEARAFNEMRIYIKRRVDEKRPIFLKITGVSQNTDTKLWVSGRLEKQKPKLTVESSLIWSETFEHYKHRSAVY
ncbi:MAG: hypothetical protein ACYTHK_09575 [Planctomycetota bacterium]|jgi:hypothetical protein